MAVSKGRLFLTEKDYVTAYRADGSDVRVPKHWKELPHGWSKTKPKAAAAKAKASAAPQEPSKEDSEES